MSDRRRKRLAGRAAHGHVARTQNLPAAKDIPSFQPECRNSRRAAPALSTAAAEAVWTFGPQGELEQDQFVAALDGFTEITLWEAGGLPRQVVDRGWSETREVTRILADFPPPLTCCLHWRTFTPGDSVPAFYVVVGASISQVQLDSN